MARAEMSADDERRFRATQRLGVGCFTAFVGFWSGGMIGVALSWAYAFLTRAPKCQGIPSCDWGYWATAGAWFGVITLPAIALWQLRRRDQATNQPNRG